MPTTRSDIERLERALSDLWRKGTVARLHASLTAAAGVEIDRPGYLVLRQIGSAGPIRVTDLAARFAVEQSTISRHARRLTQRRWVRRLADPADGRVALLEPTTEGKAVIDRIETRRRQILSGVLDAWPAADRDAFADLMERFTTNLADFLDADA